MGVELIPHLMSLVTSDEKMIHVFNLWTEGATRRRTELMAKASIFGRQTVSSNQPIEDPALKRCCIFPNFHSQIISGNMPKKISIDILVL